MSASRRLATLSILAGSTTSTLIVSVQAIVLMPLYLHSIGPRLYGAWLGSADFLVWMQAFDLGLPNLMIQRIAAAHGQGDSKSVSQYFATGMATLAIVAILVALSAFVVSFPLPRLVGLFGGEARTLRLCFIAGSIAAAFNIFNNSVVGFSRGIQVTTFMNVMMVASSLVGFIVSLRLVLTGWGLWAIALGLLARTTVSLIGSGIFTVATLKGDLIRFFRVRRHYLREFLSISPVTALGGLSYAVMSQSESALVVLFSRPELAVIFTFTRKALDMARSLVDMIAFATYGGFAHLVTSKQRQQTLRIHAEISSLRLSSAVALASAYIAVNSSLLSVWVGRSQYGGAFLTILMAVQFIVTGSSFLMNYLYRATGPVMGGSVALLAESAIRVPLMIGLLLWLGLPGIPIAGIITAAVFGLLAYRWTVNEVSSFSEPSPPVCPRVWLGRAVIFGSAILACLFFRRESWSYVLFTGSATAFVGGMALVYLDPLLVNVRTPLMYALRRLQTAAGSGIG